MTRIALFIFFIIVTISSVHTQQLTDNTLNFKEITFHVGISRSSLVDKRMSLREKRQFSTIYGLNFTTVKTKSRQQLNVLFTSFKSQTNASQLGLNFIHPTINYSYERKLRNNYWFGGSFDSNVLLTFPNTDTGFFVNNPISYTMAYSLSPKISWNHQTSVKSKDVFLNSSAEVALLTYLIRPAFGHPYPEKFLEEGTFSPTRSNIALPLLRSGKIKSVHNFQSIKIKLGVQLFLTDSVGIGVHFQGNLVHERAKQSIDYRDQTLTLGVSYRY
jgi:hypothetical protein